LETITEYSPTGTEIAITLGVWSAGLLILTLLYQIFIAVRSELHVTGDTFDMKR